MEYPGKKDKEAAAPENKFRVGNLIASFKKLDTKKKIQYVAILLLAVIILTIYFSSFKSDTGNNAMPETPKEVPGFSDMESRLEEILSKIEGAGRVEVMITYESTPEKVPAISIDKQTSTSTDIGENGTSTIDTENTQSDVVTINGSNGNDALVLRENSPKILGVIVIAQGADDIAVKLNLLKAVETVLDVTPDRVDVYKMNNE
jgi:stage III sporulation protein AG